MCEILIAAIQTVYNWNIMSKTDDELVLRMTAITHMMELSLNAPKGSFSILLEAISPEEESHGG